MGALDDAALAAFLKRVEGNAGDENSTALLNRLLGEIVRRLVAVKFDAGRIKANLLNLLEQLGDITEWKALESEFGALLADQKNLDVAEVPWTRVTVTWWRPSRPIGFVSRGEGTQSIVFKRSMLERCGIDDLRSGERLDIRWKLNEFEWPEVVEAVRPDMALSNFVNRTMERLGIDVHAGVPMGGKEVVEAARPDVAEGLPQVESVVSPWERVTVKWYNRIRGFGFFTRGEGTPDIFFAQAVLDRCGITGMRPGERLDVRWVKEDKGVVAVEVAYPVGFV